MKKAVCFLVFLLALPAVADAGTLQTSQSALVQASPDEVWSLLTDIDRWAEWNPAVVSAELTQGDGEAVGSKGKFLPRIGKRKPPSAVHGEVAVSRKPELLEYKARVMGMRIVFGFRIQKEGRDHCRVTSYETIQG